MLFSTFTASSTIFANFSSIIIFIITIIIIIIIILC